MKFREWIKSLFTEEVVEDTTQPFGRHDGFTRRFESPELTFLEWTHLPQLMERFWGLFIESEPQGEPDSPDEVSPEPDPQREPDSPDPDEEDEESTAVVWWRRRVVRAENQQNSLRCQIEQLRSDRQTQAGTIRSLQGRIDSLTNREPAGTISNPLDSHPATNRDLRADIDSLHRALEEIERLAVDHHRNLRFHFPGREIPNDLMEQIRTIRETFTRSRDQIPRSYEPVPGYRPLTYDYPDRMETRPSGEQQQCIQSHNDRESARMMRASFGQSVPCQFEAPDLETPQSRRERWQSTPLSRLPRHDLIAIIDSDMDSEFQQSVLGELTRRSASIVRDRAMVENDHQEEVDRVREVLNRDQDPSPSVLQPAAGTTRGPTHEGIGDELMAAIDGVEQVAPTQLGSVSPWLTPVIGVHVGRTGSLDSSPTAEVGPSGSSYSSRDVSSSSVTSSSGYGGHGDCTHCDDRETCDLPGNTHRRPESSGQGTALEEDYFERNPVETTL